MAAPFLLPDEAPPLEGGSARDARASAESKGLLRVWSTALSTPKDIGNTYIYGTENENAASL